MRNALQVSETFRIVSNLQAVYRRASVRVRVIQRDDIY